MYGNLDGMPTFNEDALDFFPKFNKEVIEKEWK